MWLRVPVYVKTIGSVLFEKQLLEEFLEFYFGKCGKHSNVSFLSIELIAMGSEFEVPEALELLIQVLVFLRNRGLYGIHYCSELFICHVLDFDPHLGQMHIKSLTYM